MRQPRGEILEGRRHPVVYRTKQANLQGPPPRPPLLRTQSKRELVREELRKREALYGEFISECSRLAIDALAHGIEKPETLWTAYAMLNRIRLSASQAVLTEAEKVLSQITDQYYSPNISLDEFRALVRSREADPLKLFGEACRTELRKLRAAG